MICEFARAKIFPLLDHGLEDRERRETLAHLESCARCHDEYQVFEKQRLAMRSMEEPAVPPVVTHRLRVLAAHERLRQMARASISARLRHIADDVRLFMDNMMRPVALPFGGGLLSAVLLFGILAPGLIFTRSLDSDPSVISLVTLPEGRVVGAAGEVYGMEMVSSIPSSTDSTLVELTVDRYGHVSDWKILRGELTPDVKSVILLSNFNPGTYFGIPTDSKILVALHSVPVAARS
ncbi:MAG: zf-HC2 domain-containing protein [Bryobacteraceae bacterium]|jgi:anti-sigma factor RsiW